MTVSRVARLTLQAATEAHVRSGAILLEDALRIATLPHERDARLYIVRRLDIGTFDLGAPSQQVALEIERRLANLAWVAVPATSPGAVGAPAVWFADAVAAVTALVERLVAGPFPGEWFWRHVARGAAQAPSRAAALRACLAAAAETPPGPLAVAAVVDAAERARAGALLGDLQPAEGAPLLVVTFGGVPMPARVRGGAGPAPGPLAARWSERLATWAARWGGDARATWLAALGAIASRGAMGSSAVELAEAQTRVAAALAQAEPAARNMALAGGSIEATAGVTAETAAGATAGATEVAEATRLASAARAADAEQKGVHTARAVAPGSSDVGAVLAVAARPDAAIARGGAERARVTKATDALIASTTAGEATAVAGVLFLVRPLVMLGLSAWLDVHRWAAEAGFAAHLLAAIAAAHASPDDPLVQAFATGKPPDGSFAAPASWRAFTGRRPLRLRASGDVRVLEASGRLPVGAWRDRRPLDLEAFLDRPVRRGATAPERPWALVAWRRALDCWLRRFAALRCADVVRRHATFAITPTHLDLRLPLREADTRIRLAGLDIDPGWIPWLGRVITFHYE